MISYNSHLMAIKKSTKTTTSVEKPLIGANDSLRITLSWEKVEPAYQKTIRELAKTIKSDGFRQGKVPAQLVEERLGTDKILERTLEKLLPEAYSEAIKRAGKHPVTQPEFRPIKFAKGNEVVLEAQFAEKPVIEVPNYQKIITKAKKDADQRLKEQAKDLEKSKSKQKHESAADSQESKPPTEEQKNEYRLQVIYQALVQHFKPNIPELIVKQEVRADLDQLVRQLQSMKLELDDYLARRKLTFEKLSEELTIGALGRIQVVFILDSIASEAKLTVSDEEIADYIKKNLPEDSRKIYLENQHYRRALAQTLIRNKVTAHLLAI